jgi:hypothetical protein
MAPHGNRTFGSVVAVGVICAFLVALPRSARADIGDEPAKTDTPSSAQVEDTDRPKDSILDKKPADAAVASKKAETAPAGPPFWEKWQFWAVVGGVAAAAVIGLVAIPKIAHQVNGGDVRPCNPMFQGRCFGEGH